MYMYNKNKSVNWTSIIIYIEKLYLLFKWCCHIVAHKCTMFYFRLIYTVHRKWRTSTLQNYTAVVFTKTMTYFVNEMARVGEWGILYDILPENLLTICHIICTLNLVNYTRSQLLKFYTNLKILMLTTCFFLSLYTSRECIMVLIYILVLSFKMIFLTKHSLIFEHLLNSNTPYFLWTVYN